MSILVFISLTIWVYLLLVRGNFWRCNQFLVSVKSPPSYPPVAIVIPARNEAETVGTCIKSLLAQDYPGEYKIVIVDDQSTDDTREIATKVAGEKQRETDVEILTGKPLPVGWSGKLWALYQGVEWAKQVGKWQYFLFTDADIQHPPNNLTQLVALAETNNLDLVSLMVKLHCEGFWEKLLIPAFVFFFQKLYPFAWVNDRESKIAAAAGGCILISQSALTRIGGIQALKDALIDDCTLASMVKNTLPPSSSIWLGLTNSTFSLRRYNSLGEIWQMVSRTAFAQLNYSPWLLIATVVGMAITYLIPPVALVYGMLTSHWLTAACGFVTWLLMAFSYLPTLRLYHLSPVYSLLLWFIALLYTLMTIDSAWQHWQGRGGQWKGRIYSKVAARDK
ncbi:MAG: glycosyltransferase [Geminocystis sp.]|nr:glycosyltransferase [Geminocystis sp.]MCS7146605.1 glycosyltransferase [Geminocystis sp.]MDW8462972.1 glycosyltransferase [Geminocystis sp.]HIK37592.1 glycosyltransferase [Geminocystis sp. M7585_C2015_104]